MSNDIDQRVRAIIAKHLEIDLGEVKSEASFIDDLGADSLAIVELVLAFEEEFELDIPDEETERIRTVQNAVDYISSRVTPGRPTASA
jgi:acyl carrier protein